MSILSRPGCSYFILDVEGSWTCWHLVKMWPIYASGPKPTMSRHHHWRFESDLCLCQIHDSPLRFLIPPPHPCSKCCVPVLWLDELLSISSLSQSLILLNFTYFMMPFVEKGWCIVRYVRSAQFTVDWIALMTWLSLCMSSSLALASLCLNLLWDNRGWYYSHH